MICYHVLTQYPVSRHFADEIKSRVPGDVVFTNLAGNSAGNLRRLWKMLRGIRAKQVIVAVEDEASIAAAAILQILASVTHGEELYSLSPGEPPRRFSRLLAIRALFMLGIRSFAASAVVAFTWIQLARLMRTTRSAPAIGISARAFYLNANVWFGVKAGGSVGHISGVVNGFSDLSLRVTFASASGRLMVDERAECAVLSPLKGFAFPPELNCYVFASRVGKAVKGMLRERSYAFIYQRLSLGNAVGAELSRAAGIPLICEYNGSEAWIAKHWGRPLKLHRLAVLAEDVMLRHAHLVVTVSDVLKDELIRRGVEADRIVMYPNCVDPRLFNPERFSTASIAALRARYEIPVDSVVLTFVGTFGQWHGVDVLAKAIRRLLEEQLQWLKANRVRFLLVGDGAKMGEVREILAHPARNQVAVLSGLVPQAEAPLHLAASDVLLSPHVRNSDGSRFFGSPTKLFEYMAMGRAIIASDLDQIGAVMHPSLRLHSISSASPDLDERAIGLLVSPGSVEELVEAIKIMVEQAELRSRLGANARNEALAKYTWRRHVQEIITGLQRVSPPPTSAGYQVR